MKRVKEFTKATAGIAVGLAPLIITALVVARINHVGNQIISQPVDFAIKTIKKAK